MRALCLSLILALITPATGLAAELSGDSIFLLSRPGTVGCGTGFVTEDGQHLYTNAHVAKLFCSAGRCPRVVLRGSNTRQELDLSVHRIYPVLDVAVLTLPTPIAGHIRLQPPLPLTANTPLSVGGYPGCGSFAVATGTISEIDPLHFTTTAQGASGSSGSPIVDREGRLLGIAHQSDSVLNALRDKLLGGRFSLRAARADVFAPLIPLTEEAGLQTEATLLLQFYRERIQHRARTLVSSMSTAEFINGVAALRNRLAEISPDEELLRVLSTQDNYPGVIVTRRTTPPTSPLGKLLELLVFAANVEQYGPRHDLFRAIDSGEFERYLAESGREKEQQQALLAIVHDAQKAGIPGLLVTWAVAAASAAVALIALLIAFGWTLGYTFARAGGGTARRFAVMLLVGVAVWPISFLLFLWLGRRRHSTL